MKTYFALEVISVSAVLALSGVSAQGQSGTISGFITQSSFGIEGGLGVFGSYRRGTLTRPVGL